jgi:hypothetical protein
MLRLKQTLKEAKSDAAKQEKRAAIAELRAAELAAELTKLQRELQLRAQHEAEKAAQEQATSLGPKLDAVTQQLSKSQAELRAEREWSGRVDAQLRALHKEATELHQQDAIRSKRLEQERDTLRDTVRRHEEQLHRANQALADLGKSWRRVYDADGNQHYAAAGKRCAAGGSGTAATAASAPGLADSVDGGSGKDFALAGSLGIAGG